MRKRKRVAVPPITVRDPEGQDALGVGRDLYQDIKHSGEIEIVDYADGVSGATYRSLEAYAYKRIRKTKTE
jgi:hypothetical protein